MAGGLISKYLATIGSIGGKKSRRTLTPAQARAMVKAREAKRPKKPKASTRRANDQAHPTAARATVDGTKTI